MIFFILLLLLVEVIIIDVQTAFLSSLLIIAFWIITLQMGNNKKYKQSAKVYSTIFAISFAYALLCFLYMSINNYTFLFALDTQKSFLPTTMDFLSSGENYNTILSEVWGNFDLFSRFQAGYYTVLTFFGYLAKVSGANIYFTLQLANILITSFSSVFIYRMLIINNLEEKMAVRYSLIISSLSILFIYNSVILRDGIVATLFIYVIYMVMSGLSTQNIIKAIVASLIMTTFRIESGLSCFIFIPFFFIVSLNKKNSILIAILSIITLSLSYVAYVRFASSAVDVYNAYYENYAEGVDLQSGLIGHLQRIPIIGQLLSIIFTFLMPIPCWLKLSTNFYGENMPEAYNIMNFPMSISAYFHTYILSYLSLVIINKFSSIKEYKYRFLFIPALVLLLLQSSVVESRRVMGLYVVFFVFWAVVHNKSKRSENRLAQRVSIFVFILIQFFAIVKSVL